MIGVLVVTHGQLAAELLAAARTIAGELPNFRALSLEWQDGLEEAQRKIAAEVDALDAGDGVLVLVDMFGATPSNAASALAGERRIEVLTGVNLPMVVRLACTANPSTDLGDTARWLETKGRRSICRAGGASRAVRPGTDGANGRG